MIYGQNFKFLWYDQEIPKPNNKTTRKSPNSHNTSMERYEQSTDLTRRGNTTN